MALASIEAAHAQYIANAGWRAEGDAAKCRLFVEALTVLLAGPQDMQMGRGSRISINVGVLERRLRDAESWLAQYDAGGAGAVRYGSFRDFRS